NRESDSQTSFELFQVFNSVCHVSIPKNRGFLHRPAISEPFCICKNKHAPVCITGRGRHGKRGQKAIIHKNSSTFYPKLAVCSKILLTTSAFEQRLQRRVRIPEHPDIAIFSHYPFVG
ncbi:MAG: hypothetical protein KIG22_06390, partial [Oxalobacter sp.]|nr:hypothetical protein [Oxalobacter sp.]